MSAPRVLGYGARASENGRVHTFERMKRDLAGFQHVVPLVDGNEAKRAIETAYDRGNTEFSCDECNGRGVYTITSNGSSVRHACTCVPDGAAEIVESHNQAEAEVARLKGRLRQAAVALGAAADRGLSVSEMVGAGRLADEIERELGDG